MTEGDRPDLRGEYGKPYNVSKSPGLRGADAASGISESPVIRLFFRRAIMI